MVRLSHQDSSDCAGGWAIIANFSGPQACQWANALPRLCVGMVRLAALCMWCLSVARAQLYRDV